MEKFQFSFEYIGGGYFRKRNVKRGEKAETLHGDQAVTAALEEYQQYLDNECKREGLYNPFQS